MVYSAELGYDPEEWEECPEPDHFLVLSMWTRVCLSIGTVLASALFFWVLEAAKRHRPKETPPPFTKEKEQADEDRGRQEEEETMEVKFARASEEAALKAQPERRRNSKRELTEAEHLALLNWEAEVQLVAEERLRASQEPDSEGEEQKIGFGEQQHPLDEMAIQRIAPVSPELEISDREVVQRAFTREEQRRPPRAHDDAMDEKPPVQEVRQNVPLEKLEQQQQLKEGTISMVAEYAGKPNRMDFDEWDRTTFPDIHDRQEMGIRIRLEGVDNAAQQQQQQEQQVVEKRPEEGIVELLLPLGEQAKANEQIRAHSLEVRPGATPPSTPPGGISLPELAAHYRQMADELTRKLIMELDEMEFGDDTDASRMAIQLQHRHQKDIEGRLDVTGAPQEVRQRLARQLESHVAEVVSGELRKRASSSGLAKEGEGGGAVHESPAAEHSDKLKKGSSGESSEDGFVKVRKPPLAEEKVSSPPAGAALRTAMTLAQSPMTAAASTEWQHGLTPSPQLGGPGTEEHEEQVRVSVFEGDGGSTTADDIEYVASQGQQSPQQQQSSKSPESATMAIQQQQQRKKYKQQKQSLGAEETEQVLALLQEYDLSAGEVATTAAMQRQKQRESPPLAGDMEEEERRRRQVSSGAATSSGGGVISLPDSAQPTPAGGSSVPESPDSAAFDFVSFPPEGEEPGARPTIAPQGREQVGSVAIAEQRIEVQHFGEVPPAVEEKLAQKQAEQYLREALDYMGSTPATARQIVAQPQQQSPSTPGTSSRGGKRSSVKSVGSGQSAFVVEEEMLESVEERKAAPQEEEKPTKVDLLKAPTAGDGAEGGGTPAGGRSTAATSRQIGTNEAFDRPDAALLQLEDADDDRDVTYAPEIQSMEVPPDQLSQADSLNLVDEEQFSEEHQHHQQQTVKEEGEKVGENEEEMEEEELVRAITPCEEEQLHRDIDRLRRTPSPLLRSQKPQQPQAPQFLRSYFNDESTSSLSSTSIRQSSLLSALGVTSTQEMLLRLTSLEALSEAMRKAGLESSNLIFGIDYTASNKYQGERSFGGRSLHSIGSKMDNPYQQVIKIMGKTLAPFAGHEYGISVFGFGDSSTGDWAVFPLNGETEGDCNDLDDVLKVYNRVTPAIDLSGPTNFAPLIYRSIEICHKRRDYHILVIIADGQVTNEKATMKAIVSACQYPLSIIVVGVGDGPWDMMRIFDDSLPKRPWDNFHFVEFHELINQLTESVESRELAFAVHSLLEIPDQYAIIRKLGMLSPAYYTRPQPHSPRSKSPRLLQKNPADGLREK